MQSYAKHIIGGGHCQQNVMAQIMLGSTFKTLSLLLNMFNLQTNVVL